MKRKQIKLHSQGLLDFHSHSTHSDGGDTPTELVKRAKRHGVSAMALTDHNIDTGLEEFKHACKEEGILAIPYGTELHAELPKEVLEEGDNEAPDIIVLGKNAKPECLRDYQTIKEAYELQQSRPKTIEGLRSVGFYFPNLPVEKLDELKMFHEFIKERNNLDILVKYVQGIDSSVTEEQIRDSPVRFMNRHLYAIGKPAYVKRLEGFSVADAVSLADAMNCKVFVAHPGGEYGFLSDSVLNHFVEQGVHGIEVRSYFNTAEQNAKFDQLAVEHKLIRSGGSDCHGDKGPFKVGCYDRPQNQLPKDLLEELWFSLP